MMPQACRVVPASPGVARWWCGAGAPRTETGIPPVTANSNGIRCCIYAESPSRGSRYVRLALCFQQRALVD